MVGTLLLTALVWCGALLTLAAHGLEQLGDSTIDVRFPHFGVATVTVWVLIALTALGVGALALRPLHVRRPALVSVSLVVVAMVVLFPITNLWQATVLDFDLVALGVGTAVLAYPVLSWAHRGTPLYWRAPAALVTAVAVTLAVTFFKSALTSAL